MTRKPGLRASLAPTSFTLVEIVVAIAVISFAIIALVGLLLVGIGSMHDALSDTATSLVLQDTRARIAQSPFVAGSCGPWYYDVNGNYVGSTYSPSLNALYRVDVTVAALDPSNLPAYSRILCAKIAIAQPVLSTGLTPALAHTIRFSCYVTPTTGVMWTNADSSFQPNMDL